MREEILVNELEDDGFEEEPMPQDLPEAKYVCIKYQMYPGGKLKHEKPVRNIYFSGSDMVMSRFYVQNVILGGVIGPDAEKDHYKKGVIISVERIYDEILTKKQKMA